MTLKATWLWNGVARGGKLTYGFSETWYTDDAPEALLAKMSDHARIRTNMMATGCTLYGFRIADTAPGSRAFTQISPFNIRSAARAGFPNVPQDAALCKCFGTIGGTVKRFWFHNLPDEAVEDADWVADKNIPATARRLINDLADKGFKFRFINPGAASADIQSIDINGNVVLRQPLAGIAAGNVVQLLHVRGVDGRGKRGKFIVDTVTTNQAIKLAHWPGDVVGFSGKLRLVTYLFTSIAQVPDAGVLADPTIRPGVRKCGRPFGQLRGRAPARR